MDFCSNLEEREGWREGREGEVYCSNWRGEGERVVLLFEMGRGVGGGEGWRAGEGEGGGGQKKEGEK